MNTENPLLVDTGRGFSIYYRGRHLYNTRTPKEAAERKSRHLTVLPETVVFIPSPLLFYGVGTLLERLPPEVLVIALELDQKLASLCSTRSGCLPEDPRLIYTEGNPESLLDRLTARGIWRYRRVKLLTLSGGYTLYREEYSRIRSLLENAIRRYWQNRMTTIHMGPLWIKNIFINIRELSRRKEADVCWEFSRLAGSAPILVAGAGESIEGSIEDIRAHREKIRILAVDTVLPVLHAHSITPDFIAALDAQLYNLFDIHGFRDSAIPLFFDLTCYPGLVRNFRGKLLPFLSSFNDSLFISRLQQKCAALHVLPALGSVGITALYLAQQLTEGPILFTGLDFSYTLGKSHAKGAPAHLRELSSSGKFAPAGSLTEFFKRPSSTITGKNNKKIRTNPILLSYAATAEKILNSDGRIHDIGRTGIKLTRNIKKSIQDVPGTASPAAPGKVTFQFPKGTCTFDSFFREETERLTSLYTAVYQWLSERKGKEKDVLSLLEAEDFLYLHFPDKQPYPRMEAEYLKRILVSAAHYLSLLERLSITFKDREER